MQRVRDEGQSGELQSFGGSTWEERSQSLRAGGLGAIVAALTILVIWLINHIAAHWVLTELDGLIYQDGASKFVSWAIALFSGFLFAVTYRYVIRQDQNPHLKAGAVGAFSLVRGLALVETSWQQTSFIELAILVGESFLLFGSIRLTLDWALIQGWVLPFKGVER